MQARGPATDRRYGVDLVPDVKIDDLDRRLIAELRDDPRIPYASLGKRLGVSGMTAATRLNRLRSARLLRIRVAPELARFGLTTEVYGLAQVEITAQQAVLGILQASPYVLKVDRIMGEFDLVFRAAFPSESALGQLVRELQTFEGLRRLVVYHLLEQVKHEEGWSAVFVERAQPQEKRYELAPGVHVPQPLEERLALAASWVDALARADLPRLRELSDPDIIFTIMPPHRSAGTFAGLAEVEAQAERTRRAYNRLWYRIIAVHEAPEPYAIVIDALSPVEDHRGRIGTAFSRMAFGFANGKVKRVVSLGELDLHALPDAALPETAPRA